ncbi:glycosyl transferase family 1 [Spirochaetia bacterium]|nr:glycosyl transferase family 1 [Spirochaetia bacterium]
MGGAQHVIYEIVKHLDYSKYKATIICTDGRVYSLLEEQMIKESVGNYSIIFLKNHDFIRIQTNNKLFNKIINRIRRIALDLIIIPEFINELKRTKPDIIHAHQRGIWAAYWAIPHGIPIVTTIHTNPSAAFLPETESFIFKTSLLLRRNILIAISRYNAEFIKAYWHLSNTPVFQINNGIELRNYYHKPHKLFAFINVSRHDVNKNQSLILRALARLHYENTTIPMKLYLVGHGITHDALKQEAAELGIAALVEFTGYIISAAEYLAISDVYISSSHREGLPLSVLEAMAAKLPVIATDVGGVRDLAQENGILIADDNEEALYEAMKKLRDNDDLRKLLGEKSLCMVQEYSVSAMTAQYYAIFDEFAKKSKP